jgi:glycerol transport system permease protein
MRGVLTIAVLLRWMDSFLIYAEPFALTGGGPGNSTTFLSIYLVKLATGSLTSGRPRLFSDSTFSSFCCSALSSTRPS